MVPILFEDNHLLIVSKPSGLLSQGDGRRECLTDILKEYLRKRYNKSGNIYLGGIHRLDAPVSGAIIFTKTSKAAARLSEMMKKNEIQKLYIAICGCRSGMTIDRAWNNFKGGFIREGKITTILTETDEAKTVEHDYRFIEVHGNELMCAVRLITGRKHQIRAFMKSIEHPVIGDNAYGGRNFSQNDTILLHALSLSLNHPVRKVPMQITAPLPAYFPDWVHSSGFYRNTVEEQYY